MDTKVRPFCDTYHTDRSLSWGFSRPSYVVTLSFMDIPSLIGRYLRTNTPVRRLSASRCYLYVHRDNWFVLDVYIHRSLHVSAYKKHRSDEVCLLCYPNPTPRQVLSLDWLTNFCSFVFFFASERITTTSVFDHIITTTRKTIIYLYAETKTLR